MEEGQEGGQGQARRAIQARQEQVVLQQAPLLNPFFDSSVAHSPYPIYEMQQCPFCVNEYIVPENIYTTFNLVNSRKFQKKKEYSEPFLSDIPGLFYAIEL